MRDVMSSLSLAMLMTCYIRAEIYFYTRPLQIELHTPALLPTYILGSKFHYWLF